MGGGEGTARLSALLSVGSEERRRLRLDGSSVIFLITSVKRSGLRVLITAKVVELRSVCLVSHNGPIKKSTECANKLCLNCKL